MVDKQDHSLRRFQWAALGIVLLTIAIRLPSLLHPQPVDSEGIYSVVANEIVDGGRPYLDAVERKPPLLFWTYAAVFELAGKYDWKVLHMVALVWTLATMAGLYMIGTRLFDRNTGLIAALFYSVFQPCGRAQNIAFDGELLMNLPIVWAWAIGLRRSSARVRPELLLSGALLGAGFLPKQPAAIAAVPLGIYPLLLSHRTSRSLVPTASVIHAAMLTTGFFGTLALVGVVLHRQGILREAIYWTITDHTIPYVFWKKGTWDWLELSERRQPLETGRYLLQHSAPNDRIFVWGQTSQVCLDAPRRPACRYIATFPLTGYVFGGLPPGIDTRNRILPGAWATLENFAKHPPAYIVDNQTEPGQRYPVRDFPILAKLLAERYQPVARTAEGVVYRTYVHP